MKSSTQVFASLVAALATLSQSAIAASNPTFPRNSSIDWHSSSLDSSPANSFKIADKAVIIDNDALTVGSINRTNLLKCSESAPCIEDKLVIDSYKKTLNSDGAIREVTIALYNTSPAPAAIEVYSSDGRFKSIDFVDGVKPGFRDFGDLLQTTASGLIEPFTCVSKGSAQCWNEFKYGRYGVKKSEKKLKLQTGDVIRISRGSEPARLYADILEKMDILELMIAGSEINPAKKTPLTLKNNFSPELRRKIIAGYIKKKMNEKYTWAMIMREFGYATAKKTLNNPLEFFNNATEVAKNIPADFWEATTDGTIASKVAGDGLSLIIESASKKASLIVDSALFISQSVNIYARSTASENAFKNPYPIVVAYAKLTKDNAPRVTVKFPEEPPSPLPKKITKTNKNIRIEIIQNSVVVGGDPDVKPTGWKGFEEYSSLAFVKFQIRIFRNGKMFISDDVGPYSYRGGALPELVQIKNLDGDKELEVAIHFRNYTGSAKYRMLAKYYYDWSPTNKKYERKVRCYQEGWDSQC